MCLCLFERDPLLRAVDAVQRKMLDRAYGPIVLETARSYARRSGLQLDEHLQLACLSIAMKYTEDEPLSCWDLFPGLREEDLIVAEWTVLEALAFRLR